MRACWLAGAPAALALAGSARAADEEIQVYIDDMLAKGAFGLDVHVNDVLKGQLANADFPGEQTSQDLAADHPRSGLRPDPPHGGRLPSAVVDLADGQGEVGGFKGRISSYRAPDARATAPSGACQISSWAGCASDDRTSTS